MNLHISSALLSSFLLYNFIPSPYCFAIEAITPAQVLTQEQTLTSSGQIFELGFFSPGNSGKNYVGIWYKDIPVPTIVWVANRERPLIALDSSPVLTIGSDGNLMLVDDMKNTVWSTNISVLSNNSMAVLLDDGNFVLKDSISGEFLWQSFDHPCDTFLPNMKIGINIETGERLYLASWETEDDPSPGKFSAGVASEMPPQSFIWNGTIAYWRSGQWNGAKFTGVPEMNVFYSNVFNLLQNSRQGTTYFTFNIFNNSYLRNMIISSVGTLMIRDWDAKKKNWSTLWEGPSSPCDIYGACGPYGVCNRNKSPICRCLNGFVPKSSDEWSRGNWTGGCVRRTELLCGKNTSDRRKDDGFWKLGGTKLPDLNEYPQGQSKRECETWCLKNCSCMAYAYVLGIGCMVWPDSLMDIQEFSSTGEDLYLRLATSELGHNNSVLKLLCRGIVFFLFFLLTCYVLIFCFRY